MKKITLYSTNKQSVTSYDMNYIRQYHYPYTWDLLSVRNSDTILDKQEVQIKYLPIERFCWSDGKEIFTAFDEELREIIGCSQEKFKRDVDEATEKQVGNRYSELLANKAQLEELQKLSLWATFKGKLSRIFIPNYEHL